jgi:hypothetical protein
MNISFCSVVLSLIQGIALNTDVPPCSQGWGVTKNMLLGYHCALRQQAKQLARDKIEIQKRKDSAIAASAAFHKARSDASYMNSKRHRRQG